VIAVVVGTLVTWLVHSSLSIVLLVMSFAGRADRAQARAGLVIGANIGGALAPYLAQSGADVAAAAACRSPT
jgi:phosphate:Na+ symporter